MTDLARELLDRIDRLEAELKREREKVEYLIRQLYGSKSEKLDAAQLELLLDADGAKKPDAAGPEEEGPAAEDKPGRRGKRRKQRLRDSMAGLPERVEELIPEEVRADPAGYDRLGEERSERLRVDPARYWRDVLVRPWFVRRGDPDAKPVIAPLPPALLESSVLSASLGANLLNAKFVLHQPFYRQQWALLHAHGIDLDRTLMCHWQGHLAELLRPLWQLIAGDIRRSGHVQADETPIDYLQPGSGKAQSGYLWTYYAPGEDLILYDWQTSRAHDCLDAILKAPVTEPGGEDFTGLLQTDGYAAYRTWIDKQPAQTITHVSCLAHIRREFHEARHDHPRLSGWILRQIGQLYAIEGRLRKSRAGPALRHAVRRAESLPIHRRLAKLFAKLIARHAITPRSPLGKALGYGLKQWPLLLPVIDDGRLEIDNNLVENGIRPTKLGMRNWLFIGRESTGWQSAVIYTLVENVRRAGHNPEAYLRWVFERLPAMTNQDDLRALLPAAWVQHQQGKRRRSAA
jgi:transposase